MGTRPARLASEGGRHFRLTPAPRPLTRPTHGDTYSTSLDHRSESHPVTHRVTRRVTCVATAYLAPRVAPDVTPDPHRCGQSRQRRKAARASRDSCCRDQVRRRFDRPDRQGSANARNGPADVSAEPRQSSHRRLCRGRKRRSRAVGQLSDCSGSRSGGRRRADQGGNTVRQDPGRGSAAGREPGRQPSRGAARTLTRATPLRRRSEPPSRGPPKPWSRGMLSKN